MRLLALLVLVLGLVAAPSALAGGWATAGVSSLPDGTKPGEPWNTQITLMQHGRTPLEGVSPAIVVTGTAGGETRFDAKPTDTPGVYDVAVIFPKSGTYSYTVDDGFGNAFPHKFAPVTISADGAAATTAAKTSAPAAPAPADDGLPLAFWLLAGLALVLGAAALTGALRGRGGPGEVQAA